MIGTGLVRFWACIPKSFGDSSMKFWGIGLVLKAALPGLVWKWT
jgi:hypothetical protein